MVSIHVPVAPDRTPARGRLRPTSAPSVRASRKQVFAPPPVCPQWPVRESKAARELSGRFALGFAASGQKGSPPLPPNPRPKPANVPGGRFQPFSSRRVVGNSVRPKPSVSPTRPSSAPAARSGSQERRALQDAMADPAASTCGIEPDDLMLALEDYSVFGMDAGAPDHAGPQGACNGRAPHDSTTLPAVDKDTILQLLFNLSDVEAQWVLERWLQGKPCLRRDPAHLGREPPCELGPDERSREMMKLMDVGQHATPPQPLPIAGQPRFVRFWVIVRGGQPCVITAHPAETLQELQPRLCAKLGAEGGRRFRLMRRDELLPGTVEAAEVEGECLAALQVPIEAWCTGRRFSRRTEEGTNEIVTQSSLVELFANGSFKYEWHYRYHDALEGDTMFKDDIAVGVWEVQQAGTLVVLNGELTVNGDPPQAHDSHVIRSKAKFSKNFTKAELSTWGAEAIQDECEFRM